MNDNDTVKSGSEEKNRTITIDGEWECRPFMFTARSTLKWIEGWTLTRFVPELSCTVCNYFLWPRIYGPPQVKYKITAAWLIIWLPLTVSSENPLNYSEFTALGAKQQQEIIRSASKVDGTGSYDDAMQWWERGLANNDRSGKSSTQHLFGDCPRRNQMMMTGSGLDVTR